MLPLVAVSTVGLISVMALGLETGALHREQRLAQTAADAGALAGAAEIYRDRYDLAAASAQAETARNGFTNGANGVTVTPSNGPVSGYYISNANYIEVVVSRETPTLFGNLLGRTVVTVKARGVAGVEAPATECLAALDPSAEKALNVSGSTTRLTVGCGTVVNSTNSKAVLIESSGTLNTGNLGVTGGIDQSGGNIVATGSVQTQIPPSPDPLAYIQMPSFNLTSCDYTNVKVASMGVILSPGIYCGGLEVTSSGSASMLPGLYILRGGGLKMGGGRLTGTGVTFINTNARAADGGADKFEKIEMGSASQAVLSAMTSGSLAGILFYQDPTAGKTGVVYENVIASGSSAILTGTLYFPTQPLELGASGSTTTVIGGVVSLRLKVTSGSQVTITSASGASNPFKRVSLVE